MKAQPSEWEKIFANEATDKGVTAKKYTVHAAQYHKNEQPNPKVGQKTKQTFLQRRHAGG